MCNLQADHFYFARYKFHFKTFTKRTMGRQNKNNIIKTNLLDMGSVGQKNSFQKRKSKYYPRKKTEEFSSSFQWAFPFICNANEMEGFMTEQLE